MAFHGHTAQPQPCVFCLRHAGAFVGVCMCVCVCMVGDCVHSGPVSALQEMTSHQLFCLMLLALGELRISDKSFQDGRGLAGAEAREQRIPWLGWDMASWWVVRGQLLATPPQGWDLLLQWSLAVRRQKGPDMIKCADGTWNIC